MTDELKAYHCLQKEGYIHFACNHSKRDYVHEAILPDGHTPVTVTINHLESTWHELKGLCKNHMQKQDDRLLQHERELMFRHNSNYDFWELMRTHSSVTPSESSEITSFPASWQKRR